MVTRQMQPWRRGLGALFVFIGIWTHACKGETGSNKLDCHDAEGNVVPDGTQFIPDKKDPCQTCHCEDGFSIMCTAVSCSPPACIHKAIEGKCCEFVCLDNSPTGTRSPGHNGTGGTRTIDPNTGGITNLGLRLAASTITSFLVLALLLFMIHKLRQRRLLMTVRRLNSSRRRLDEVDHERYLPDAPPLGMTVPPYQDPPPPYSPPKPPTNIAPGEPPPPYEAINNNTSTTSSNGGGRIMPGQIEPPPAYQGRTTPGYLPAAVATRTRRETTLLQSHIPQGDTMDSCDHTEASFQGRPVEDTRVKEVFRDVSCGASQDELRQGRGALRSTSWRMRQDANTPSATPPPPPEASQDVPQSVINVFGPRCIRKSGSVEIVRQSISPRNSYYLDGVAALDAMSQSLDPTVLSRMLNGVQGYSPNASLSEPSSAQQTSLGSGDSREVNVTPETSHNSTDASLGALDASERRRQFRLSSLLHSPVESFDTPASPLSPVEPETRLANFRSNSVNSGLSWVSVCSETGEPRKSNNIIKSDCQYPEGSSIFPNHLTKKWPPGQTCPPDSPLARGSNSIRGDNSISLANYYQPESSPNKSMANVDNAAVFSPVPLRQGGQICMSECSCASCQSDSTSPGPWERKDSSRVKNRTNCSKMKVNYKEPSPKCYFVGKGRKVSRSGSGSWSNKSSPKKAKQRPLGSAVSVGDKDRGSAYQTTGLGSNDKLRGEVGASNIYQLQGSHTVSGSPYESSPSHAAHSNNRLNNKDDLRSYSSPRRSDHRVSHPNSLCSDV